jgi:pimeloyl-ACP methyl ester carboxylesterase
LGRLPLVVLTRGVDGKFYQGNAGKPVPRSWQTRQRDLVGLSTNSTQIIANRSGHYIHLDQPDLVIAAINRVVTGKV